MRISAAKMIKFDIFSLLCTVLTKFFEVVYLQVKEVVNIKKIKPFCAVIMIFALTAVLRIWCLLAD